MGEPVIGRLPGVAAFLLLVGVACGPGVGTGTGDGASLTPVVNLTEGACPGAKRAASNPSGTRVIVDACFGVDLSEIANSEAQVIIEDPLFMTSAFAWIDDERVVVSSTDPRVPVGEVLATRVFAIVNVSTREIERFVTTTPQLSVDATWQMFVEDGRYLVAPVVEGAGHLSDILRIDLETGDVEWLTRTPDVAERAPATVPGGLLVGAAGAFGQEPRVEFIPDAGQPSVVLDAFDIETIQVVGDAVFLGGTEVGAPGVFGVWVAALDGIRSELEPHELASGRIRFPFVEIGGDSMLATKTPRLTGEAADVVRLGIDLSAVLRTGGP